MSRSIQLMAATLLAGIALTALGCQSQMGASDTEPPSRIPPAGYPAGEDGRGAYAQPTNPVPAGGMTVQPQQRTTPDVTRGSSNGG
jgi:hypothetical protein